MKGQLPRALGCVFLAASSAWLSQALAQESDTVSADVSAPSEPASSPAEAADALIQRGIELRKAGDDRAALSSFQQAYSLAGSARALAQMALAEQALGLWREAHQHLSRALAQASDAWITEHRATLEHAAGEIASQLGSLEISCNVAGAEVLLDGQLLGRTPLSEPLSLVAGANVIQVQSEGYFDFARQIYVDAGRLSRLNVVLTASPKASSPSAVIASPEPSLPLSSGAAGSGGAPAAELEPDLTAREAFLYTSLGLSALGASAGVTGYIIREVYVRKYNDDSRCDQLQGPDRTQECSDEHAAYRAGEVVAIAGFSGAAIFGLLAAYLWWDAPAPASETAASFTCSGGLGGVGCEGSF